jgi:2,3-bisphosphoglycerate-independent phosphoglycerate mutase
MADWPSAQLGGKTLLQYADTPNMDRLARLGCTGRLITVAPGFHPGSEVANMSVLGYDLPTVYEGRGVLEAANIGVDLQPGDMAMRCNVICIENDLIKNHSAGHISTEEAGQLIDFLNERLGTDRIRFYKGVQYRHLLVIKGGDKHLDCTPPHDVPLKPFRPLLVKAQTPEAQSTAELLNTLILKSQELLAQHRRRQGSRQQHLALEPRLPSADDVALAEVSRHSQGCGNLGRRFDQRHRQVCRPAQHQRGGRHRIVQHQLRRQGGRRYRRPSHR